MEQVFSSCNLPRKFYSIQCIGCLFILNKNNLRPVAISENVVQETGLSRDAIYNLHDFTWLLKESMRQVIYNYFMYKLDRKSTRIILLYDGKEYYCHSYKTSDYTIVELEKKKESISLPFSVIKHLQNDIEVSKFSKDVLVGVIRKLTGFKRVMLYEFEHDWCGKVTAEVSGYDTKYKDVYFHESDVPMYVRGLFCKNPMRYIYDINSDDIDIHWGDLSDNEIYTIDSRNSELVATVESHKRYLKSMECVSSFSVAVLVDLKLFGIVICHDSEKRYISPFVRQQCYNFVSMYSENISNNIRYTEKSTNDYLYKLYKMASIFNFVSEEENRVIFEYIIKEVGLITGADDTIGVIKYNGENILSNFNYMTYIISQRLGEIEDIFHTNDVVKDFQKMFGITIPYDIASSLIIIKFNDEEWVGFINRGEKSRVMFAGKQSLYYENGKTFPRTDFVPTEEDRVVYERFELSRKNINYIKQLFLFFIDRLNKKNYFTDYFITHNSSDRQMIFSNIVHEIRNPINGIVGLFDIINEKKEYSQEYVDDGMMICRNLLNLTTNIIDLSRYSYNQTLKFTVIHWESVLSEVYKTYKYIVNPGVVFKTELQEDMPGVITDCVKVRQILNNIVSNAVKFTKEGSIVLSVSSLNVIDSRCWIKVSVKDTGCGISKDNQVKLFKTFEQHNTDYIHSSGLGLVICSQIVNLFNGYIEFESEEGVGTTFDVYLPMVISNDRPYAVSVEEQKETRKLNILVVDDDYINRKVLQFRLEQHSVDVACSGQDAIDKAVQKPYDIVFMDLQMPGIDGIQATSILREKYGFPGKIVAVTGHNFDESFYVNKGFDGFIVKPVVKEKLDAVIRTVIK